MRKPKLSIGMQIVQEANKMNHPTIAGLLEEHKAGIELDRSDIDFLFEQLRQLKAESDMERGRRDAKIAVLTQVLAKLARDGQRTYAKAMLKKSDEAWVNVKPEDLVVAQVNKS
jgi:hypothetical protein